MPQAIDRVGSFRGRCVEHAVNTTKNGFPQFAGKFVAEEFYDSEAQAWVPWAEYDMEIMAYLVLFTDKGPLLNAEQCKQAWGWDGASLAELNDLPIENTAFQFRVEEDDYNGKTSLKVVWIDAFDANPERGLKKLDPTALKDLDAKFGLGKKVAPAKAPGKPAAPPKKAPPAAKQEPKADPSPATAEGGPETAGAPSAEPKAPAPKAPPAAPPKGKAKAKAEPEAAPKVTKMTKQEAWASVAALKRDDVTDEQMLAAWMTAMCGVQGVDVGDSLEDAFNNVDEETITPEQWLAVRDGTLKDLQHYDF